MFGFAIVRHRYSPLVLEEDLAAVRAVDRRVTHGASLALRVLRMRRVIEVLVALQTKRVHSRTSQQPRIRGPVRGMAARTALRPHRLVFKYERSAFVRVTLVANGILGSIGAEALLTDRAVDVVAVLALDIAVQHAMTERLHKVGLRLVVAREAKVWRLLDQQLLFYLWNVCRVARRAAYAVLVVRRALEILVFKVVLVAGHTLIRDLLRFGIAEAEDLRLVAAAIDVCGSRSVTRFAPMPFLSATLRRESLVMRRALYVLELILVTRLAIVSTNVLRGITSFLRSRRFRLLILRRGTRRRAEPKDQRRDQHGGDLSR
jgi:hypothetical protein